MITTVIYDMDGLLIDSEPFWQQAEIDVFKTVGINLTVKDCLQTQGLRIDEVVEFWYKKHPWEGIPLSSIQHDIIDKVIDYINTEGRPKVGVKRSIEAFQQRGLKLAVASSSFMRIIDAALTRLGIQDAFEVIYSAEYEEYGKPHPGIFITTAQKLGVQPEECIVLEDSLNGVIAAKAARMTAIAIPEYKNPKFVLADMVLKSLGDFYQIEEEFLND